MVKFKTGLVWGALAGSLWGLLKAPQSGKATRYALKEYINQTQSDVRDLQFKLDHLQNLVQRLQDEGLVLAEEFSQETQVKIRHFIEENQPRIKRINRRLELVKKDWEVLSSEFDKKS